MTWDARQRPLSKVSNVDKRAGKKQPLLLEDTQTEGPRKRQAYTGAHQHCPAKGCGVSSKFLKDHVYKAYISSNYHQLERQDRRQMNTHRQCLPDLELAVLILGSGATVQDLVAAVNKDVSSVIAGRTNI